IWLVLGVDRWPCLRAKPCGARRAERLGRSGGQGQRRSRRTHRPAGGSPFALLQPSASCFSPGVIHWRCPFPFYALGQNALAGCTENVWSRGCWNFLPAQSLSAVLDGDAAVPPLAHQHFALCWRVVVTLRLELEKAIVVPHHPVLANDTFALQPENSLQFCGPRRAPVIVLRLGCHSREAPVVFWQIFPLQIHMDCFVTADVLPPQFLHQPVLMRAVNPLHPPLGLRRTGGDDCDP